MKACDLNDRTTFYASPELLSEVKGKPEPHVNFAYTDYGGSFLDKVFIRYFSERHPESIVKEYTNWNGENAFIFGDIAREFLEETANYPLGFEDTESFFSMMEDEIMRRDFERFINDCETFNGLKFKENALDSLIKEKAGAYAITTQGLDYSESELIEWCLNENLCKRVTEETP